MAAPARIMVTRAEAVALPKMRAGADYGRRKTEHHVRSRLAGPEQPSAAWLRRPGRESADAALGDLGILCG